MVTRWGLSEELGPLLYDEEESDPFNRGYGQGSKPISEELQQKIDATTRKIIDDCYAQGLSDAGR